ncbi:MAG TPA: hypothetical protein VFM18_04810 [Methanosarcina sp.]|nr:hypothetical protein [Methanosarcina sp.]
MAQISSPYPNNLHDIYGTASVIPAMITNDMWSNANTAQQLNQQQAQQDIDRASQMNPLEIEGRRLMNENQSLQNVFQGYNNTLEGNKAQISNASLDQDVANAPELSKLKLTEAQIKAHSDFGDALSNLGRQWKASGVMPDEIKSMGAQFQNPDQAIAAGDNITKHTKEYMASIDHANIAAAASRYAADQQTKRESMAIDAGKYMKMWRLGIEQRINAETDPTKKYGLLVDAAKQLEQDDPATADQYRQRAQELVQIVRAQHANTMPKAGSVDMGGMGVQVNPETPLTPLAPQNPQSTTIKTKSGKTVIIPNQ